MPGQSLRLSTFSGHHVDVEVSSILTAECDPLSIGREVWIRCLPLEAGDAPCRSTSAWDSPNIIRVSESNLRCIYRWCAQQTGRSRGGLSVKGGAEGRNNNGGSG